MIRDEVTIIVTIPRAMDQQIKDICSRSIVHKPNDLQYIFGCIWRVTAMKVLDNSDFEVTLVLNAYDNR